MKANLNLFYVVLSFSWCSIFNAIKWHSPLHLRLSTRPRYWNMNIWFHGCTCVYILKLGCNVSPGIPLTGILMQNITCINHWWIQYAAYSMQCVVQYYVKWNVSLNLSLKNLFCVSFLNVYTNAVWLTVHHLLRLSKYHSKNVSACDSMPPLFNGTFFSRSSQQQNSGCGATAKNRQSCQETDGEAI